MFGGKRRRATKAAIASVNPFIRTLDMTYGIPRGFWSDPYVLGFLTGCIITFANASMRGPLSKSDAGAAVTDTYKALCGINSDRTMQMLATYAGAKDPEYQRGLRNADKTVCAALGLPAYEDDPDVLAAKKEADTIDPMLDAISGPATEQSRIAAVLQQKLFYDEVQQRLGD